MNSINPIWETTSHLMYECNKRNHTVYFLEPHDLYIRENKVVARMHNITVKPNLSMKSYWQALIDCRDKDDLIFETVADLDAIFLRKDPPLSYQVMEFLGPVSDQVFMINHTSGQVKGNSKAYILNFPEIIPETHVSRDPQRLKKIIDNFGGDMVVKPLKGHGGHGVIKVSNRDQANLSSLINYYVRSSKPYPERSPIMVQEYLKNVEYDGDVRILLLNGEILGGMRRRSLSGDFRTNVHVGAKAYQHTITAKERDVCEYVKEKLVKDGLYFVGIDIIGDKLVEVNCVSPGGIPRINLFNDDKLEAKVVDFIEDKILQTQKANGEKKRKLVS
ncbi:MAG: glutathione synthase [Desulfobacteraceae bacterium]|nr:glutathione synthase [Desulfobacteraceae bacterium]